MFRIALSLSLKSRAPLPLRGGGKKVLAAASNDKILHNGTSATSDLWAEGSAMSIPLVLDADGERSGTTIRF